MKQVIQNTRKGKLEVKDIPIPKADERQLLVQTTASLISAGTERMVIDFAKKTLFNKAKARPDLVKKVINKAKTDGLSATLNAAMARLDQPLPLGYSAAGTVLEVGRGIEGSFRVGDRVAIAGAGIANHAEICAVPRNLAAPIPEDVSDKNACYGTISAVALHAVRNLDSKMGETVAVVGVGLVGQLACQLLGISGVRVIALDYNPDRLKLAESSGSILSLNLKDDDITEKIFNYTHGLGCDGILVAAATPSHEPLKLAASIARDRARVCLVGLTGTQFPYAPFMKKELSIVVSRSYGPGRYDDDFEGRDVKYPEGFVRWTETENLAECLRLMSPNLKNPLNVGSLTTHTFPIDDAELAYKLIVDQSESHLGIILTYSALETGNKLSLAPPVVNAQSGACVVGIIGAGHFTRNILLPNLSKINDINLDTIVSKRGISAEHLGKKYRFRHFGSDKNEIFKNPDIHAVLIATRHDTHSQLTSEALSAGKNVFVEKPLGLTHQDIDAVQTARNNTTNFFHVNFNRRFAPFSSKIKSLLHQSDEPKLMMFRVNAGPVPLDSWINSPTEGGGRILGELCHFIDLARFFADSPINSILADAPRGKNDSCSDVTVNIRFGGGSLAVIVYTSLGDSAFPKENYEIYSGGTVIALDNFRRLSVISGGKTTTSKSAQDKGFGGSLNAFFSAAIFGAPLPIEETEILETSYATLAVMESLETGKRIYV